MRSGFARSIVLVGAAVLCGGCHLVAIGVAGVVVSQEFTKHAQSHLLEMEPNAVWLRAKATLAKMANSPLDVDDEARAATGTIDGATVTMHVDYFDENRTRVAITARKWGVYDNDLAQELLDRIKVGLQ